MTALLPLVRGRLRAVAATAALLLPILVGLVLRSDQLREQVLIEDEWHALHKLLHASGYADIASHFGYADYSIPLTLWFRFLAGQGWLSEDSMHLLPWLAGGALLVWAWRVAPGLLSARARQLWLWLLALSPLMIYHSRTARPYALTTLLVPIAIAAFWRWSEDGPSRRRWAALYLGTAALATWLHPVCLPFLGLPFVFVGGEALLAARDPASRSAALRRFGRAFLLGLLLLVLLALLLAWPLAVDRAALAAKSGSDAVTAASAWQTASLWAGSAAAPAIGAIGLAFAVGAATLCARDRRLGLYLLLVIVGGSAAIAASHATMISHGLVWARYCQPVLPLVLGLVALGVDRGLGGLRSRAVADLALVPLVLALVAAGPLPRLWYRPNQFMGDLRFQYDYDDTRNPFVTLRPETPVPPFYRTLAALPPGSLRLIETPWRIESGFDPQPDYQRLHRQRVLIGLVNPLCGPREFGDFASGQPIRLRNFVHLDRLLAGETRGARYLVVHRRLWALVGQSIDWPDMEACLPTLEAKLGPPLVRDDDLVVFDLAAPRPD